MCPSTVDLLRIRDGEPVDAAVRAAVDEDPRLRAELEDLAATRRALQALPELEPPPGIWERVDAQLAGQSGRVTPNLRSWPLRGTVAVGVAAAALWVVTRVSEVPVQELPAPATIVGDQTAVPAATPAGVTPTYASLVAESARLERALDGLRYEPRVVRASTATTIADLEDRIAWNDERRMFARELQLSVAQKQELLRERNELMNALVQVRYADARRFAY